MTSEERKQYAKERRDWLKAHGVCIRCGNFDAEPNRTTCLVCLIDTREHSRESYRRKANAMSEEERAKKNAEKRRQYADKKERGICQSCSSPVYKNYVHCYKHYISMSRAHDRERKKKYAYHPSGTCRICGEEPFPGKKLCPTHYEQYAERIAKRNKERSEVKRK